MTFVLPGAPPVYDYMGPYNVLGFTFGTSVPTTAAGPSASLFNGHTLLGTHFSDDPRYSYWVSFGAVFPFDHPAVVDFTSLLSGSIQGRMLMRIASGSLTFDSTLLEFNFGATLPGSVIASGGAKPIITGVSINAVREPGTASLIVVGLFLVGVGAVKRRLVYGKVRRSLFRMKQEAHEE